MVIPKIPRGTIDVHVSLSTVLRITLDERTHAHTRIYGNNPTNALAMYYTPIYIALYALVGRAISVCDQYICAVLQVCPNGSHAVFYRPVV